MKTEKNDFWDNFFSKWIHPLWMVLSGLWRVCVTLPNAWVSCAFTWHQNMLLSLMGGFLVGCWQWIHQATHLCWISKQVIHICHPLGITTVVCWEASISFAVTNHEMGKTSNYSPDDKKHTLGLKYIKVFVKVLCHLVNAFWVQSRYMYVFQTRKQITLSDRLSHR